MSTRARTVLIASSDRLFAEAAAAFLDRQPGWQVAGTVSDGVEAAASVARIRPSALLILGNLRRLGPAALARHVGRRWPDLPVVVVGALEAPDAHDLSPDADGAAVLAALRSPSLDRPTGPEPEGADRLALLRKLTKRELSVLRYLADGLDMAEIARELRVSVHTVRTHMQNLYEKLGCHSRLDVLQVAMRHGLVAASDEGRSAAASTEGAG